MLLILYLAVVNPLLTLEESWSQELTHRAQILVKYQNLLASKNRVSEANKGLKTTLVQMEAQFLSGGSPAVASAELQEILKNLAKEHGVQMTSAKVLQAREVGPYLEVPVQVQMTATISQLVVLLYHLEHEKKLLFIPEININAPRLVKGKKGEISLQVNLVVSGVIRKGVPS